MKYPANNKIISFFSVISQIQTSTRMFSEVKNNSYDKIIFIQKKIKLNFVWSFNGFSLYYLKWIFKKILTIEFESTHGLEHTMNITPC